MFPEDLLADARRLHALCEARGMMLACAESCTGGLVSACLTAVAGSSKVVERGFVTYTNEAKRDLLGVPPALFDAVGAVSEEVARAMADGALQAAPVDLALSVTGVAGPGASHRKPAGLVYVGCALRGEETQVSENRFPGDRDAVRLQSVGKALAMALARLS